MGLHFALIEAAMVGRICDRRTKTVTSIMEEGSKRRHWLEGPTQGGFEEMYGEDLAWVRGRHPPITLACLSILEIRPNAGK